MATVEISETNQTVEVQSGVPDATSLQGNQLPSSPSDGELLRYNGTEWTHLPDTDHGKLHKVVEGTVNAGHPDFTAPYDTTTRAGRASAIQDAIDHAEDNGDLPFVMAPDSFVSAGGWDASSVNYSGTGGTWTGRMVREGQSHPVDVMAFGAAGNGPNGRDDLNAVDSAASWADSNGFERIYHPPGTYTVSADPTFPGSTEPVGEGASYDGSATQIPDLGDSISNAGSTLEIDGTGRAVLTAGGTISLRITDSQAGQSWAVENNNGDSSLQLRDETAGNAVVRIKPGAPADAIQVDAGGDVDLLAGNNLRIDDGSLVVGDPGGDKLTMGAHVDQNRGPTFANGGAQKSVLISGLRGDQAQNGEKEIAAYRGETVNTNGNGTTVGRLVIHQNTSNAGSEQGEVTIETMTGGALSEILRVRHNGLTVLDPSGVSADPDEAFHVQNGNLKVSGGSLRYLALDADNGNLWRWQAGGSAIQLKDQTDGTVVVQVDNGAGPTRIASNLKVGDNSAPVSALDVAGTVTATGLEINPANTYSLSNVTTDRSFDADNVTVSELADVLATLIQDMGYDA